MSPRLLLAGFLGLLLLAPMVVSEFHVTLLNYIGLYAIVTLGLEGCDLHQRLIKQYEKVHATAVNA